MKQARENHLWERFFIRRDEISIAEGHAFSKLPLGEVLNPTTCRLAPKKMKMPGPASQTLAFEYEKIIG